MLAHEIKNIKANPVELRKFGLTIAIALAVIAAALLWKQKNYPWHFFAVASAFTTLAFIGPTMLKPVHKCWMSIAVIMGWIMTGVILVLLFYLIVTPIALTARICGKAFLDLKFDKNNSPDSFWIEKNNQPDRSDYEKQF